MSYDEPFYEVETEVALRSAAAALPVILPGLHVSTVIDVGCGTGAWAWTAHQLGYPAVGVDHGVPAHLRLPDITYVDCDLSGGYPCSGFDLAICLEVAEHLEEPSAVPLVNGLARAKTVLFSAATPGQPGLHHVNCQPHDYWHGLFAEHGLHPTHIGPDLPPVVEDFYRRNTFIYERNQ